MFKNEKFLTLAVAHRYLEECGANIPLQKFIKAKGLPDSLIENADFKDIWE